MLATFMIECDEYCDRQQVILDICSALEISGEKIRLLKNVVSLDHIYSADDKQASLLLIGDIGRLKQTIHSSQDRNQYRGTPTIRVITISELNLESA